jgi:dienelactone hydrolase
MESSVCKITNGRKSLIVCFGGMALQFDGIPPFEFLNYLSQNYTELCDLCFLIDKKQCWYQSGIDGSTKNVEETISYLDNMIETGHYEKVIFMGISAGGYGAILFGSLCKKVQSVVSFIPQTILKSFPDSKYHDLKDVINPTTLYLLHGDVSVMDENDLHHISQCEHIKDNKNVVIHRHHSVNVKEFRNDGSLKNMIDEAIFPLHSF